MTDFDDFLVTSIARRANDAGLQYIDSIGNQALYLKAFVFGALMDIMIHSKFTIVEVRLHIIYIFLSNQKWGL